MIDVSATFTPSQLEASNLFHNTSRNLFITGQAGTGKSYLLNNILTKYNPSLFPLIASTGAAAVLIGGSTFHSFFGLELLQGGVEASVQRALTKPKVISRIERISGFILDEVSMISDDAFEAAKTLCEIVLNRTLPWGGLRVIAVGDFFQLPPVSKNNHTRPWVFRSKAWGETGFVSISLQEIMRCNDEEYLQVLSKIRVGVVDTEVSNYLNQRLMRGTKVKPTKPFLHARRNVVDKYNEHCLNALTSKPHIFRTVYKGYDWAIPLLVRNMPIAEEITLKVGSFVMIRINDKNQRYVNGSVGFIQSLNHQSIDIRLKDGSLVTIKPQDFQYYDADGKVLATATNYPLSLAYAMTIHKSQGSTMDEILVDLSKLWEPGQAYVALSRLKSGNGLTLLAWDRESISVDKQVLDFYNQI